MPSREPDWGDEEFLYLVRNLGRSDKDISKAAGRSVDAVAVVRAGLTAYAKGQTETTLLSDQMRDLLRDESTT